MLSGYSLIFLCGVQRHTEFIIRFKYFVKQNYKNCLSVVVDVIKLFPSYDKLTQYLNFTTNFKKNYKFYNTAYYCLFMYTYCHSTMSID